MRNAKWTAGLATALLMVAVQLPGGPAHAADSPEMTLCMDDDKDNAPRIAACTKVIGDTATVGDARIDALVARGMLFDDEEQFEKAIADFTEALKLAPDDHTVLVLRGNSHDGNGAPQLAIADYTAAIKVAPDDAAAYYNRATVYEDLGDKAKAIADYTKAIEIDPEYAEAKEALADLQKKK